MTSERNAELESIKDALKECMNRLEVCVKEEESEAFSAKGLTNACNILEAVGKIGKARLLITYACSGDVKDE